MPATDWAMFIMPASVLIAISASWVALYIMYHEHWVRLGMLSSVLLGGVVMGLAIASMHYVAMLGMHIPENSICRTDSLAIDPHLLAVEGDVMVEGQRLVLLRLLVGQSFDLTALEQGLFHDFRHIPRLDLAVENALGVHHHDRPHGAEAAAAGLDDPHLIRQPAPRDLFLQRG